MTKPGTSHDIAPLSMIDGELAELRAGLREWPKDFHAHRLLATIDALKDQVQDARDERDAIEKKMLAQVCDGDEDRCTRDEGLCDWHHNAAILGTAEAERDEQKARAERAESVIMMAGNWPQTVGRLNEALSTFPAGRAFLKQWTDAESALVRLRAAAATYLAVEEASPHRMSVAQTQSLVEARVALQMELDQ
jgi:hypothetical protein